MHRSARLPTVVVAILAAFSSSLAVASEPSAVEQATALLAKGDPVGAIDVLESAIGTASPRERARLLAPLHAAYESALRTAVAESRDQDAERFRENLKILDRKNKLPRPPAPPTSIAVSPSDLPAWDGPQPAATGSEERHTAPLPSIRKPAPRPMAPLGADPPTDAPALPLDVDVTRTTPAGELEKADNDFRAKRFLDAGRVYEQLARERQLPDVRKDAWAYCLCAAVVERLNTGPKSPEEWASIRAEIDRIRKLSPKNWYGEYLRNLVAERTGPNRTSRSRKVVLRGASPDEPASPRPVAVTPRAANPQDDSPAPAAPVAATRIGKPGTPINNWKVWDTANFRILHTDDALADKVARVAETTRDEQTKRWAAPVSSAWTPRCDIYLYPSASFFHQITGQPEESPGFSTMGINSGRIVARRINLRADNPKLLAAILPHEVTHVLLADLFPSEQIPRWADEGMAVLSEPMTEQHLRAAELEEPLQSGRLFRLQDLMIMDYPDGRHWGLYYAQSVSLTHFLVSQGTPAQFVRFVRDSQRNGVETELKRTYHIQGFDDLDKRWRAHAKSVNTQLASARPSSRPKEPLGDR